MVAIAERAPRTQRRVAAQHVIHGPSYQAYQILHAGFVAAPVIAGLDKFTDWLVNWDRYLAPLIVHRLPISSHLFMMAVGVVEIFAALLVAVKPRIGSVIVAFWLAAIIFNLLISGQHFDIALRDFGLLLAAVSLNRLSSVFDVESINKAEREQSRTSVGGKRHVDQMIDESGRESFPGSDPPAHQGDR